ncbi:MAG: sulfatase-like hydrolase/transferase, partial [Verrucomicrobiota bacterium]
GNGEVQTPHIDSLARDGMVFDRHYNTTAICMASRASIMTGLFEYRNGCNFEHGPLLKDHWSKSYPMKLREAGYLTAMAGKIGFTVSEKPGSKGKLPQGDFDRWGAGPGQTHFETVRNESMAAYADKYPHATRAYGAFGSDFIKAAVDQKKPFCLSISFKAPHRPVQPDPIDNDVYEGKTFTKPPHYGRDKGTHLARQSHHGRQYERFHSWGYADNYDKVMAKYYQQIYAVDVAVGMIREALKRNQVDDNTVVVFTSDNGFLCGALGYGSKVLPYEDSTRAPLIVVDPRTTRGGKRCRALTGNVDIAPTFLELAGLPADPAMDGKSLVSLYKDPEERTHRALPLINVWGPAKVHSFGVVTETKKFVYWPHGGGDLKPTEELFDLKKDPYEMKLETEDSVSRQKMSALYDAAVVDWKTRAVPYHGYQKYGILFDRSLSWEKKVKSTKTF